MSAVELFEIVLDAETTHRLEAQGIDLTEALVAENPDLRLFPMPTERGVRDIVAIIGATATLAPMVVPIARELIARLLPRTEINVETITANGNTITKIHTRQT